MPGQFYPPEAAASPNDFNEPMESEESSEEEVNEFQDANEDSCDED